MKRFLLLSLACLMILPLSYAQSQKRHKPSDGAIAAPVNNNEIHWMNIDDVQAAMRKEPKKVWIDVYTGWCGWCKRMDKTTFSNPNVIKYMNEHFYAVKLDAEQKGDIRFMGKMFSFDPEARTHAFALQLLGGKEHLSYPTSVYMEPNFQSPMPIPGYQDVKTMEMILKYLGEGTYKKMPFDQFQASFKATWM